MSIAPLLRTALVGGALLASTVALVGGLAGFIVAGVPGTLGALFGAGLTGLFFGLTAASMLVAGRLTRGDLTSPAFFGIVLGVWFFKVLALIVASLSLRDQQWLDPGTFFVCLLVAVLGSLLVDATALLRSRVPYVSDLELPGTRHLTSNANPASRGVDSTDPAADDGHRKP